MDGAAKTCALLLIVFGWSRLLLGADILAFYPFPGISHHKVYWPVLRQLADRGHNVTMISPFSMPHPPQHNYTEIKVPDYMIECKDIEVQLSLKDGTDINSTLLSKIWTDPNIIMIREMGLFLAKKIVQDPAFEWLLKSDSKFDLILGEFTFVQELFVTLAHRFQASHIDLTSFGNFHWSNWIYGNHLDTSTVSDFGMQFTDRMSLSEKLHNTIHSLACRFTWYYYYLPIYQVLADRYIVYPGWQNRPSISDLLSNTSMLLMNSHHSLNYPYSLAPHVKEIGGVNLETRHAPLDQEMKEFMDGAEDGVIYFSMGSYLQGNTLIDRHVRDEFLRVFTGLKQRTLWKWEEDIQRLHSNILVRKWMPQHSILAHPNCKLFISHGGFLSLSETVINTVPMLIIPVFADQHRNARMITTGGMGITLDLANLTSESISWAIGEIISNPSYKEKIIERSQIYQDKPESALETAVYWIEYVIRHKGAHHLRPAIATMPWYQQAMIDVYAAIAAAVIIPIYIIIKILAMFCKLFNRNNDKYSTNKNKTQ